MNSTQRIELVEELAEAMYNANVKLYVNGGHEDITKDGDGAATLLWRLAPACLPIIERVERKAYERGYRKGENIDLSDYPEWKEAFYSSDPSDWRM